MSEKIKETFVLSVEHKTNILRLSLKERGYVFTAIFEYADVGNIDSVKDELSDKATIVFEVIKNQIDRFEKTHKQKSAAGKKGMESRWGSEQNITKHNTALTKHNTAITSDNPIPIPIPIPIPEPVPVPAPEQNRNIPNMENENSATSSVAPDFSLEKNDSDFEKRRNDALRKLSAT